MGRIWLSGVTDDDADDVYLLIVANAIETCAVTHYASDFSFFAGHAHITHHHRVHGGYDDDGDADVRGFVPYRHPRYCSNNRGACGRTRCSDDPRLCLVPKVCCHDLAVDDPPSPHLQRQCAAALSGGEPHSSVHRLNF